jgi:hypothetical protein
MALLHRGPFAADVTAADARVSYDPRRPAGPVFAALGPAADNPVAGWQGEASFPAAGRAYGRWGVETDGGGGAVVTPAGGGAVTTTVTPTAVGDAVALPGSRLSVVVPAGAAGVWVVTLLTPPPHRLAASVAALTTTTGLFKPGASAAEARWAAAWADDNPPLVRAQAAALALAARTAELGGY